MSQIEEAQPLPLEPSSEPRYSPDGRYWWDGWRWSVVGAAPVAARPVPVPPTPVKVTNAFAVGFFGFLGAFAASVVFWVVGLLVFSSCVAAALHNAPSH